MATRKVYLNQFPMPGQLWCNKTVIASCTFMDDEYEREEDVILVLNEQTPFYTVAEVYRDTQSIVTSEDFENIVPATIAYQEWGGAWGGFSGWPT